MQADIGFGLLITILISHVFGVPVTWGLSIFCVVLTMLPDIDFVFEHMKHGSVGGTVIREHRELIHFPVLYIPITALVWIVFGYVWAAAFFVCILVHFIHDSIGIGWGIQWLWPFSRNYYKVFATKDGSMSFNLVQSWTPREMPKLAQEHGLEDWVKKVYLKPFPIRIPMWLFWFMIAEWGVFFIGFAAFVSYTAK